MLQDCIVAYCCAGSGLQAEKEAGGSGLCLSQVLE